LTRTVLCLLITLAAAAPALAQRDLPVVELGRVRVDGMLRDWGSGGFRQVGSGDDAALQFRLGHDAEGFYVAARVRDERMVRTARPGPNEDAIVVTLAFGRRVHEVWLYAGVPGRAAASAAIGTPGAPGRPVAAARVVEAPAEGGYALEAFIPWSALPGHRLEDARGGIRLRDVDREARPTVESEPALGAAPDYLPLRFRTRSLDNLRAFARERSLDVGARPRFSMRGQVFGDARPEDVYVFDRYVVVTGAGFRDGGYGFAGLPVGHPEDVRSAELRELTGDDVEELVVVLRQRNDLGERDLWQVWSLADPLRPIFAMEVRKATAAGHVEAAVEIRTGEPPTIVLRAGRAEGLDASTYREDTAEDAEAILPPWGPVRERWYRWDGRAFTAFRERANPRYRPPEATRPTPPRPAAPPPPPVPPEAPAPSTAELMAEFRRRAGIPASTRPRFQARANLAGSRAPEVLEVHGRTVVVGGPGIREGRAWLTFTLPAAADEDVLSVRTADVTGDRRHDVLVTLRQIFGDVERHILLVHRVTEAGVPRILAQEVLRRRGEDVVENQVRTRGGALTIGPGRARGFSAERWPFTESAEDTAGPILLPWRDRPVRFRFRGGRLQR
jgi:hypothetical protein